VDLAMLEILVKGSQWVPDVPYPEASACERLGANFDAKICPQANFWHRIWWLKRLLVNVCAQISVQKFAPRQSALV
jgi:hypothetical protein